MQPGRFDVVDIVEADDPKQVEKQEVKFHDFAHQSSAPCHVVRGCRLVGSVRPGAEEGRHRLSHGLSKMDAR